VSRDARLKKQFFVAGKAIVMDGDNVLLIKKRRGDGYFWDTPGGCIQDFETPQEAMEREFREEITSVKSISTGKLLNTCVVQRDIKDGISLALIFYDVQADFAGSIMLSDEHDEYYWVSPEELPQLASEGIEDAVRAYKERQNG
jgi:8-oxo-dGTP diphosphatase